MSEPNALLTLAEAAAGCGLTASALRAAVCRGALTASRVGSETRYTYYVTPADLARYLAGRVHGNPGERNGQAKLSAADIPVIRARHAAGDSLGEIARDYGVGRHAIRSVITGRTWRHVR